MKVITETGRAHLIRYLRFYSKSSKKSDTQQLPSDYTFWISIMVYFDLNIIKVRHFLFLFFLCETQLSNDNPYRVKLGVTFEPTNQRRVYNILKMEEINQWQKLYFIFFADLSGYYFRYNFI
jgi:hypothetical protein